MLAFTRLCFYKSVFLVGLFYFSVSGAYAVTMLTIPGSFSPPGISGTFPDTAEFSWIKHRFPSNAGYFSWNFGGGTDGGIIFDQPQAFREMTDVFVMFNQPAGFFSINSGLSIGPDKTIDMSNLRMTQGGNIIDIGSGSGFDTLVPYFDDFSLRSPDQNGWSMDVSGAYHLFYNTRGTCAGCEMTIHLYGSAVVPVPAALWLFGSGLLGLAGFVRRYKV
ncbi:hypothetical protein MNBD_GAMMA09-1863 [hydrothermal vent metagenome]|uniref:PEP-CTERM protein-sorting domain-containing protein n=1 Tax=hydrothermal vent metagenome TaxID=652676 RepID=A0A3B0XKC9_9ZZZZ